MVVIIYIYTYNIIGYMTYINPIDPLLISLDDV